MKWRENSRNFVFVKSFAGIWHLFGKILVYKYFLENIKEDFRFHDHFRENLRFPTLTCPCRPVEGDLSARLVQSNLSRLSSLRCPIPDVLCHLSCHGCPVPSILSRLSCPGCSTPATLSTVLLKPMSCPPCNVLAVKTILWGKGDGWLSCCRTFQWVIFRRQKNDGKSFWSDKAISSILTPLNLVLCSSCDRVPLKFKRKNRAGLQFTSTGRMSIVSKPLRIRWTIPLREIAPCRENCAKSCAGRALQRGHYSREDLGKKGNCPLERKSPKKLTETSVLDDPGVTTLPLVIGQTLLKSRFWGESDP